MAMGANIYCERVDLWDNRPVAPLQAEFEEHRNATMFKQAVDASRQIQRGILEKQACITEDDLKFFLGHARVLCFLVHELIAQEAPSKLTMEDFVQGTPIAPLLDPQNSEYNRIALRLNGGQHTLHDAQNQWGPLVQEEREAHSESPDRVSIPELDEDEDGKSPTGEGATVVTGSEWSTAPHVMILGSEVTIPMMDVVLTSVKFTVPDSFTMDGMTAWLSSAMDRWLRLSRVEWQPRARYYVEFDASDTALRVKGLVDARDGIVCLVEFAGDSEFSEVASRHSVVTARTIPARSPSPPPVRLASICSPQWPPTPVVRPPPAVWPMVATVAPNRPARVNDPGPLQYAVTLHRLQPAVVLLAGSVVTNAPFLLAIGGDREAVLSPLEGAADPRTKVVLEDLVVPRVPTTARGAGLVCYPVQDTRLNARLNVRQNVLRNNLAVRKDGSWAGGTARASVAYRRRAERGGEFEDEKEAQSPEQGNSRTSGR
ncbi:hypothetical protein K438DRAFT_2093281 [Mycena galopus ATCC 62051]|nr:hypothetical protein K438DRAFT_2093281 [Mycena galopus ATCC 62051]